MRTIAVHESQNSEKVVRFIEQELLNDNIASMLENGCIVGLYYDENSEIVAEDIWGDIHTNVTNATDC